MATKKFSPKQIVAKSRQIEVLLGQGKCFIKPKFHGVL